MPDRIYMNVIVPLKLEWEPCYFSTSGDIGIGSIVCVDFAGKEYYAVVSAIGTEPQTAPSRIREITEAVTGLPAVTPEEIAFWRAVAGYYMCTVGEVYKAACPAVKLSAEKAGRKKSSAAGVRKSQSAPDRQKTEEIMLSPAQDRAFSEILESSGKGRPVLLNGVTGSGKTEIYAALALETLKKGRNVLYLVPEIAMSRQLTGRLGKFFGDRLIVFHSAETPKRRAEAAEAVRSGEPYVVLGTRSTLFLPHRNLGLIIVDEEHDSSYKQESPAPRYNGRDAAIMLGAIFKSDILLGSATPSLESLYNCMCGRFSETKLPERYFGSEDSEVEIIDTNAERKKRGMKGSFSRKLIDRIASALESGGQVMLLRTRRSYSPVLQCPECGHMLKCPHCNVSLSYHKDADSVKCHYCGHTSKSCMKCPECGSALTGLGAGTQKIEEEAAALFPEARIARLDSDTDKKTAAETIKKFEKGEIDILTGTQIVAKGFDFDSLSLVAVLQADTLLGVQDFRADEKAMQILEQFRGRCGRRGKKGLFVIQTAQPEHPVYRRFIRNTGMQADTSALLAERKAFGYPPFTRIIDIQIRDISEDRAVHMAEKLLSALGKAFDGKSGISLTGPLSHPAGKVADKHIRTIRAMIAKDRTASSSKALIAKTVSAFEISEKYSGHIHCDVDPE